MEVSTSEAGLLSLALNTPHSSDSMCLNALARSPLYTSADVRGKGIEGAAQMGTVTNDWTKPNNTVDAPLFLTRLAPSPQLLFISALHARLHVLPSMRVQIMTGDRELCMTMGESVQ
jgi:hypothetical protein